MYPAPLALTTAAAPAHARTHASRQRGGMHARQTHRQKSSLQLARRRRHVSIPAREGTTIICTQRMMHKRTLVSLTNSYRRAENTSEDQGRVHAASRVAAAPSSPPTSISSSDSSSSPAHVAQVAQRDSATPSSLFTPRSGLCVERRDRPPPRRAVGRRSSPGSPTFCRGVRELCPGPQLREQHAALARTTRAASGIRHRQERYSC